jgi:hypothetical protein
MANCNPKFTTRIWIFNLQKLPQLKKTAHHQILYLIATEK